MAALIAALAVGVLVRGVAGGIAAVRIAGHVEEATARAESRMAVLQSGPVPSPGEGSGDDGGGFRYRQFVAAGARGPGMALLDLTVTVTWRGDGGERAVTLRSRRVAPAPPEAP